MYYRTVDPIGNLELRVVLRCIDAGRAGRGRPSVSSRRGSLNPAGGAASGESAGGDLEEKGVEGTGSVAGSVASSHREHRSWSKVLKWQDKVFGPECVSLSLPCTQHRGRCAACLARYIRRGSVWVGAPSAITRLTSVLYVVSLPRAARS